MKDKEFYLMLSDPDPSAPYPKLLSGPDIIVNNRQFIDGIFEAYRFVFCIDKAAQPLDLPPADIYGPSRHLLFSQPFIEILDNLGVDNIQYFDAEVMNRASGEKAPYKVANVHGVVRGLDLDKSEVLFSPKGNIIGIETMQLDEEKLKGHKICRLHERNMLIVVHKSIKEAVEAAGLSGFMFVADNEYEPGMI